VSKKRSAVVEEPSFTVEEPAVPREGDRIWCFTWGEQALQLIHVLGFEPNFLKTKIWAWPSNHRGQPKLGDEIEVYAKLARRGFAWWIVTVSAVAEDYIEYSQGLGRVASSAYGWGWRWVEAETDQPLSTDKIALAALMSKRFRCVGQHAIDVLLDCRSIAELISRHTERMRDVLNEVFYRLLPSSNIPLPHSTFLRNWAQSARHLAASFETLERAQQRLWTILRKLDTTYTEGCTQLGEEFMRAGLSDSALCADETWLAVVRLWGERLNPKIATIAQKTFDAINDKENTET